MCCCEPIPITHIAFARRCFPTHIQELATLRYSPNSLACFDSQSSSNSRLPSSRSRFAIRSSFFSISLFRSPRRKHSPSISFACFFQSFTKSGLIPYSDAILCVRLGACERFQCYLFLELGGVATSLVYFFVLYVCVLVGLYTLTILCELPPALFPRLHCLTIRNRAPRQQLVAHAVCGYAWCGCRCGFLEIKT